MAQPQSSTEDIVWDDEITWDDAPPAPARPAPSPAYETEADLRPADHYALLLKRGRDEALSRMRGALGGITGTASYLADLPFRVANDLGANQELPSSRAAKLYDRVFGPTDAKQQATGEMAGMFGDPIGYVTKGLTAAGRTLYPRVAPATRNEEPARALARQRGMEAGYKFTPATVPGTPIGNAAQVIGQTPALNAEASTANRALLNASIRNQMTAPGGERVGDLAELNQMTAPGGERVGAAGLNLAELSDLRRAAVNYGYEPIRQAKLPVALAPQETQTLNQLAIKAAASGRQDIADRVGSTSRQFALAGSDAVLDRIGQLRREADSVLKADRPDADLGLSLKHTADTLEAALVRGVGPLAGPYQEARAYIAQNNAVRRALREGTGDVSAVKLAKLAQKNEPLTGSLRTGALMGANFPELMADLAGGEGALLDQRITSPFWSGVSRVVAAGARPVRKALLSDTYQDALRYPMGPAPAAALNAPFSVFQPE